MGNEGSLPSSDNSEGLENNPASSLSPSSTGGGNSSRGGKNKNNNDNNINSNDPRVTMNGNSNTVDGVGLAQQQQQQQHQYHHSRSGGGGERSGGGSGGGGGRLKGGVFTRRSNAHNQNSIGIERTKQQQQQHQAPLPESTVSYTTTLQHSNFSSVLPPSSISSYPHSPPTSIPGGEELNHFTNTNTNINTNANASNGGQQQQLHQNTTNYTNNTHQQQLHLQHQQQQIYTQQQQYQQQQHQQHVPPNQQQYYNSNTIPINTSIKENDRVNGIMYQQQQTQHQHQHMHSNNNNNNNNNSIHNDGSGSGSGSGSTQPHRTTTTNNLFVGTSSTSTSTSTSTKKTRPGHRAGAAIINSMRNLNLGSAMHRIGGGGGGGSSNVRSPVTSPSRGNSKRQQQHRRQQQTQTQQVNDWETRWDEDSDEEDDEGDNDHNEGVNSNNNNINNLQQQHHQIQQQHPRSTVLPRAQQQQQNITMIRPPEIDSCYATIAATAVTPLNTTQQQQQHLHSMYPPGTCQPQPMTTITAAVEATTTTTPGTITMTPTTTKTRLVTAIPDPSIQQQQKKQQQQHDIDDEDEDDGVEWDTGILGVNDTTGVEDDGTDLDDTRPTVQQFLPLLRVLGKGSFGKVVLVQKRVGREKGTLFAMKILKKSHLVRRRQIERTRTERKVLSAVNHPFIMKLHYAFQSPDKLYLVLDYCPGGELFFHLSRFRRFPERVARFYAAELLLALSHLHKRGILYRDLKPENVLLDADGHVKLGDFGLAKAGIRHAYEGATSMCGTPEYMAPEVLAQQGHGFCVDYWGLGMLTYEMMTGLPPWYTTDRAKLFRRLRSAPLDIPPYFSTQSASFTSALLERNPRRRLGVTGIRAAMENDFFKSISWRALYGRRVEAPIRPCEGWSPPGANGDDNKQSSSSQQQQQFSQVNNVPTDLDAATANFDNQFTRMPVETDDIGNGDDDDILEELHEDTFVGFTFDDNDRDAVEAAHQQKQQQSKQRTQHYTREGHHID